MNSNRFSDSLLDSKRLVGDPLADDTVRRIFASGAIRSANELMRSIGENDDVSEMLLPDVMDDYFAATSTLPPWADPSKIACGQELFCRYGPQSVLVLHCASLPECYAAAKGVKVLAATARLSNDAQRRIVETAQMVVHVMAPGGLSKKGKGIVDCQRVRLMHAAIRHLILASGRWNNEDGLPINQEDLAGTLMTFSIVVVDGLNRLGIDLSADEVDAYLHTWACVGWVMGIDEELLPTNVEDARELMQTIRRRHHAPCPEGKDMTAALVTTMQNMMPGTLFDGFPAVLIRELVGTATADLLNVPQADWTKMFVGPFRMLGHLVDETGDRSALITKVSSLVSYRILDGLIWFHRGEKKAPFHIPESLQHRWANNNNQTGGVFGGLRDWF